MWHRRKFLQAGAASATATAFQAPQENAQAAELAEWRKARQQGLLADDGWLTLVGLHWLEPGANHIPSAPGLTFTRKGEHVLLSSAQPVAVNGKLIHRAALRKDQDQVTIGSHTYFVIVRGDRVAIRERDKQSPARAAFKGLQFYPFSSQWRLEARWIAYPRPVKRHITTVANTVEEMLAPGQAEFTVSGTKYRLEPVIEEDHLFYIFKDTTAGKATYPAGRFLEMPMPKGGVALVDFNRAHNPPCAFTPYATCPLPPRENQLPFAIEAGELDYHSPA